MNATVGGQDWEEALKGGFRSLGANTLQGVVDTQIEMGYSAGSLNDVTSTAGNMLSGAGAGAVLGIGDDPWGGAASGALGSLVAKTAAHLVDVTELRSEAREEAYRDAQSRGRPFSEQDADRRFAAKLQSRKNMARMAGAVAAFGAGLNVDIAAHTATATMDSHVWREREPELVAGKRDKGKEKEHPKDA